MAADRIALLRGINVGRAKRVRMEALRASVEGLGYTDVRTALNSGNVGFSAPRVRADTAARRIQKALEADTGVSSRVTVLTAKELVELLAANPLEKKDRSPSRLQVAVARRADMVKRLAPLARRDWTPEELALGTRVAYLWCPDGITAGVLTDEVMRVLGDEATIRNVATLRRLERMLGEDA